ncbi:ankyrin repeat domain-containing protein [Leptospira idonii]|uniref:Ankyrin repeat domain-containing protein n=1 Tax=Leptospira idonii TaxID=1193500 RepID=A0A4R9LZW9_9LEPT|nr:ankyrin repeat domain-containing protein [Leptospira idonii]TGN19994.1 ankyrin repeat domain-containing protein [Leptospira idonii]
MNSKLAAPEEVSTAWKEYRSSFSQKEFTEDFYWFEAARTGNLPGILSRRVTPSSLEIKDSRGYTALMLSSYHGHSDLTRILLGFGADPNAKDASGNSILMGVAFKGNVGLAQILIEAGADPDYISPSGQSALQMAVMFGRKDMILFLESLSIPLDPSHPTHRFSEGGFRNKFRFLSAWTSYLFSFFKSNRKRSN